MNIYLDIDETIRGVESPIEDIIAFLEYCLDHFPGQVYWLTTHCKRGVNRCYEALDFLPDDIRERAAREIQPTDWGAMKTDAIDFSKPFVWVDDTIFDSELRVLAEHDADEGFYRINPDNPEGVKGALEYIQYRAAHL
jgi:hypothetical protein